MLGIRDRTPITRKQEAIIITQRAIDAGLINMDEKDPVFVDYVKEFWEYGSSECIYHMDKKNPILLIRVMCWTFWEHLSLS